MDKEQRDALWLLGLGMLALFIGAVVAIVILTNHHIQCPIGYIVVADRYGREFCGLAGH